MIHRFLDSDEFRDLPIKKRREAAYFAQRRAFRHWQVWLAMLNVFISTVVFTGVARTVSGGEYGAFGFIIGCSVSYMLFSKIFYRFGYPYYCEHVKSLG